MQLAQLCWGLALSTLCLTAEAAWPERPVTVIVPYAAGGPMDKLARQLAAQLNPLLGQPVVISNQGGAGGNIGTSAARRAPADGYTLLLDHIHMATAPALYRKIDFNPETDFEPLGVVAESPLVLLSRPDVPSTTLGDLLRWMARQPQVSLANAGVGSASHLCGLLLQQSLKLQMTTVPYRGTGPAMLDLLGGQVDLMCDLTANAMPQIQMGKVKPIALSVREPLLGTALQSTPSMEGFGIQQVPLTVWYALYAPRDTPEAVLKKLSAALVSAVAAPEFRRQQVESGVRPVTDDRLSPAGHRRYLHQEIQRWSPVIRAAGIYAD